MISGLCDQVGLEDLGDKIEQIAEEGLGSVFIGILDPTIDDVLAWLGPKVGETAVTKMSEQYSMLDSVDAAKDRAISAASEAVMSFKDEIMEFAQDALENISEAFKKVGDLLLRACKEAATVAVNALTGVCGGMLTACFAACANLAALIQQVYEVMKDSLKEMIKEQLEKRHIPSAILDMLPWDFDPDEDVGVPKKKQRAAEAPPQEEMPAEDAPAEDPPPEDPPAEEPPAEDPEKLAQES